MRKARLPELVVIGAQKSATRWLRDQLAQDPGFAMTSKEVEYFNNHWDRDLDWYAAWWDDATADQICGDVTPGYLMWTDDPARTAARIDGVLPGTRLVAVLRNPVDRLISAFIHHVRAGRIDPSIRLVERLVSVDADVDRCGLVSGGWYGRSLAPYIERFGDRLLVVRHDDVANAPDVLLQTVARHLGRDQLILSDTSNEVAHSNRSSVPPEVLDRAHLEESERRDVLQRHFADDLTLLTTMVEVDTSPWLADGT